MHKFNLRSGRHNRSGQKMREK